MPLPSPKSATPSSPREMLNPPECPCASIVASVWSAQLLEVQSAGTGNEVGARRKIAKPGDRSHRVIPSVGIGLTGLVDQRIHAKELPRGRVVVAPNRDMPRQLRRFLSHPLAPVTAGHGGGVWIKRFHEQRTTVRSRRRYHRGVTHAHEAQRTEAEIEAREALMRQQFDREAEAWEQGVPADEVLSALEARIKSTK